MAEKDLKKWTSFFHEAGVPRGPANDYAALFCDHRIKEALLGDLTKDILNDIGISVMGDVMCILKHARAVYAKLEREKSSNQVLQVVSEPAVVLTKANPDSFQIKKKKITPKQSNQPKTVQQTETITTAKKKLSTEPKISVTVDDSAVVPKKRLAKTSMTLSERFAIETVSQPKVSRLSEDDMKATTVTVKKVSSKNLSPVKSASSEKTTVVPIKRKSAFERLGKEDKSRAASKEMKQLSPKIRITKLTRSPVTAPASKIISLTKNESSVFNRLGESETTPLASSERTALTIHTVKGQGSRIVSGDIAKQSAKSHSVLRPLKPIRAVQPVKPVSSVKARVSFEAPKESTTKSVFSRLGSPT